MLIRKIAEVIIAIQNKLHLITDGFLMFCRKIGERLWPVTDVSTVMSLLPGRCGDCSIPSRSRARQLPVLTLQSLRPLN